MEHFVADGGRSLVPILWGMARKWGLVQVLVVGGRLTLMFCADLHLVALANPESGGWYRCSW